MKILSRLLIGTVLFTPISAFAKESPCKIIDWSDSAPVRIYTALYNHVHVTLPSKVIGKPIAPNSLWKVQSVDEHLFIAPTNADELGKTTTVSVITDSGNAYSFVVEVNKSRFNPCVIMKDGDILSKEQLNAFKRRAATTQNVDNSAQIAALKTQLMKLATESKEREEEAVKQAIRKYRYHIYTRYSWKANRRSKSFLDNNFISDVYDDGRFTYLRLTTDNKSLPAVQATVNGKPEFIEAKYDEAADLYRIVGIYPELSLIYGEDEITVKRASKTTRGEF